MIKNAQEAFKSYNNIKEAFLQVKIILFQWGGKPSKSGQKVKRK